ncbi:unnamed protein product [Coffea canephora]|uniref:Uncharacterized protein n=1 Tax=Coffea canephora TaxID=49390 RepID=A0A068TR84_COFCA|nr:unnamed protein product [Coffea canephora]
MLESCSRLVKASHYASHCRKTFCLLSRNDCSVADLDAICKPGRPQLYVHQVHILMVFLNTVAPFAEETSTS